jgi:hypothetical protein
VCAHTHACTCVAEEHVHSSSHKFDLPDIDCNSKGKLVTFQQHINELHKMKGYMLSQIGDDNKSPRYFDVL